MRRPSPRAHLLVVGVGRRTGSTARELVLKVEEAAWVPSAMRDLETFLHGHLPATGADDRVVARSSPTGRPRGPRHARPPGARGGCRAGIAPARSSAADAAASIPGRSHPAGRIVVPEAPDSPAPARRCSARAGPLQLLTLEVAAARGTNPDPIRRDDPVYLRAAELADDPAT